MTHALTLTREFDGSPATVWRCLTEPDLLAQWFAPAPVTCPRAMIEPRPGGIFHVVMDVPEMGEMDGAAGCVLEALPEERLTWTSALGPGFAPNPSAAEGEFHITAIVTLQPHGSGTRYTATALHADEAARAAHAAMGFESGWGTAADQLGSLAATLGH
ncbi:MAG: SRPBCC domain-containing protein [Pseudomonadota bacterium]